jgi:hypothetical protein
MAERGHGLKKGREMTLKAFHFHLLFILLCVEMVAALGRIG